MTVVRVGFDVPIDGLFDYLAEAIHPKDIGSRVLAPFGRRNLVGIILDICDSSHLPAERLKPITRLLSDAPGLTPEIIELITFAARYYQYPLGSVAIHCLPTELRRIKTSSNKLLREFHLTDLGHTQTVETLPKKAYVQRHLLNLLQNQPILTSTQFQDFSAQQKKTIQLFIRNGWLLQKTGLSPQNVSQPPLGEDPRHTPEAPFLPELSSHQSEALQAIGSDFSFFRSHLLLGVTGSGKTEVYLRLIEQALQKNRQTLLLVPEISLTPQLEATVRNRFKQHHVVSLHSGLKSSERLQNWLNARNGQARIVLGTRLAVFTPLPDLGLIILDEEHDHSFKQNDGFRYSARDLAVVRARQRQVPIVLGSATPALETWHNASLGRYQLAQMPERINQRPPHLRCVSTRDIKLIGGFSNDLLQALALRLQRQEQSLIFINRRGYAPVLLCNDCGWQAACHRCSAKLVFHAKDQLLQCHHCGYQSQVSRLCPDCGNSDLSPIGQGTQRIEQTLNQRFPQARILRIDRDSTRSRGSWLEMRERIESQQIDILVGTQILAKGHDFANLSLVGVINADSLLYSNDFRAPEHLYALLTQVAGRAGRANTPGEVIIQTQFPTHPLYQALCEQNFAHFANNQLEERRSAEFPPFQYQALLRAEAPKVALALEWLIQAAALGREIDHRISLYDPVPASMMRLAGRERAQLLVQSTHRQRLQEFLSQWRFRLTALKSRTTRWSIDVDPLEF